MAQNARIVVELLDNRRRGDPQTYPWPVSGYAAAIKKFIRIHQNMNQELLHAIGLTIMNNTICFRQTDK